MRATVRRAESGPGWTAECRRHATFVNETTRARARTCDTLDFCDECRDEERAAAAAPPSAAVPA